MSSEMNKLHAAVRDAVRANDPIALARALNDLQDSEPWEQLPSASDFTVEELERLHSRYQEGDRAVLFHAIQWCARTNCLMPPWIRRALSEALTLWDDFDVRTLDEAFGIDRKGIRLYDRQGERRWAGQLFQFAIAEHAKGRALTNDDIFYEAGTKFGIGTETAKKWYYAVKEEIANL